MIPQRKLENREEYSLQKRKTGTSTPHRRKQLGRKAPAGRSRMIPIMLLMVVTALIVGLFIGYLSQYTALTRANYQLGELERELSVLKNQSRRLELEISRLKSPQRIERIAKEELKMAEAERIMLVSVDPVSSARQDDGYEHLDFLAFFSQPVELIHRVGEWWNARYGVQAGTLSD